MAGSNRRLRAIQRLFLGGAALLAARPALARPPQLWLYYATNLLPAKNLQTIKQVWTRAARDGYRYVLLSDSKFSMLRNLGSNRKRYFSHMRQVRALATRLHIHVVPGLFPIGYSNDMLADDPSLAEGLPVRNVTFVVHGNVGRVLQSPQARFTPMPTWHDPTVNIAGNVATVRNPAGNSRMVYQLHLQRYHVYHVSMWIRTNHFTARPEVEVLGKTAPDLQYQSIMAHHTQPWKRYDVVFDTLKNRTVSVYMGAWGPAKGTMQWRDWRLDTAGMVNVLSRPGAPTVVAGYKPGVDYKPVRDPKLGMVPWAGGYQVWHKAPNIHFLRPVPDGTRLKVSWYFPPIVYDGQVAMCPELPAVRKLMAQQAKDMQRIWHAHGYMMSIDEERVLNQDESCRRLHETPAQLLGGTVRYCVKLLPGRQLYTWTDMFDPYHNARKQYFFVHGSLVGTWKALPRNVIMFQWNYPQRAKSLAFFSSRGYRQIIAGYYDGPVAQVRKWEQAAAKVHGVIGYMYTTWQNDYRNIGAFARAVKAGAH